MSFFDKIGDYARTLGDRTNDALEIGHLNMRINSENSTVSERMRQLGALLYEKYRSGEPVDESALAICQQIDLHKQLIQDAEAEIARIRAENGGEKAGQEEAFSGRAAAEQTAVCPKCGAALAAHARFCSACGAEVEQAEPQPPTQRRCAACGAPLCAGAKFCPTCGSQAQ